MVQYAEDLTGRKFGLLTVIRREGLKKTHYSSRAIWLCCCECGVRVKAEGVRLRNGRRVSCGSYEHRRKPVSFSRKHPLTYKSWQSMWSRIRDFGGKNYRNYGSRNITIHARWKDFEAFLLDMGERPSQQHTIDRIDNNGNYEPGNCRWATKGEQARNSRRNVYVEYEGERLLLCDLVKRFDLRYNVVKGRLRMGWPLAKALSQPVRKRLPNGSRQLAKPQQAVTIATPWD